MESKEIVGRDVRDEIIEYLEKEERGLAWLGRQASIPYSTIFANFKYRIFKLSDENLLKINNALGTDFK